MYIDLDSYIERRISEEKVNEKSLKEAREHFYSVRHRPEKVFLGIYYGQKALRNINLELAEDLFEKTSL